MLGEGDLGDTSKFEPEMMDVPEMVGMIVLPCVNCRDIKPVQISSTVEKCTATKKMTFKVQVICTSCFAQGPMRCSGQKAVKDWNKMNLEDHNG